MLTHRSPFGARSGLSLTEVVVVIGILALLAAVLMPAVQQARESSRRMICRNNLRQVGLGIANFADRSGVFPTSERPEPAFWRLMPHIEAVALYNSLSERKVPDSWHIPVLLCPDDAVAQENMTRYGESNYYFNDGTQFRLHRPGNGFRKGRSERDVRPSEITDGLSNTVAISERLVWPRATDLPSADVMEKQPGRYFWWTETRFGGRGDEPLAAQECRGNRTSVIPQFFGTNAFNYRAAYGYDHVLPPNHPACYNGPEDFEVEADLFLIPASSLHPGGVNSLMADGSVHFVSENIDAAVWRALGTRNGQEAFDNPFGN